MKTTFEFLQAKQGIARRMQQIFNYHYDQIQRECYQEIFQGDCCLDRTERNDCHDSLVEFMEEIMNWPSEDNLQEFIKDISGETYLELHQPTEEA